MTNYIKQSNMDFSNEKKLKELFKKHIYSALECAMSVKNDNMTDTDFKNLVHFILNIKCQLI